MDHILRGVLRPFLENTDLLQSMFVDCHPSTDGMAAADTTAARRPTARAGGVREGKTRRGGEWSIPPSAPPHNPTTTAPADENGESREDGRAADENSGSWGYRSSLSSRGCWKVDAWAAARRDGSVELGFDSAAFDVFVLPEDERAREAEVARERPAAVVTNVAPFRMAEGLPRELGPLLFDKILVASLLAEDEADHRPPSRDRARSRRGKQTGAAEQEGPDSSPGKTAEGEEKEGSLWVKKKASDGTGPVLSHVYRVGDGEGGNVEVRIRGEPVDTETLAMAGLPQDMAALVVAADVDTPLAGTSKRPGSAFASVSGEEQQGRRKQRAAAH